jgi:hypothetical protein
MATVQHAAHLSLILESLGRTPHANPIPPYRTATGGCTSSSPKTADQRADIRDSGSSGPPTQGLEQRLLRRAVVAVAVTCLYTSTYRGALVALSISFCLLL